MIGKKYKATCQKTQEIKKHWITLQFLNKNKETIQVWIFRTKTQYDNNLI